MAEAIFKVNHKYKITELSYQIKTKKDDLKDYHTTCMEQQQKALIQPSG